MASTSFRRVPGVAAASATVAPAQPARGFRMIIAELEENLDRACDELADSQCDGGDVAGYLTDRWSLNLRFWICDRMFAIRAAKQR